MRRMSDSHRCECGHARRSHAFGLDACHGKGEVLPAAGLSKIKRARCACKRFERRMPRFLMADYEYERERAREDER